MPPGNLYVHGGTVRDFGIYLQRFAPPELNRPIVDQTDIRGRFEFELHYTPDGPQNDEHSTDASSNPASFPGIFTAMHEQLGLELKATRAQVDVLDIISVSLPSPN